MVERKMPGAQKNAGHFVYGGERGIRTLDGALTPYSLSRRAPSAGSAISPDLRIVRVAAEEIGGGSRIRTHGAVTLNGFQDRRLQPLGHPSLQPRREKIAPFFGAVNGFSAEISENFPGRSGMVRRGPGRRVLKDMDESLDCRVKKLTRGADAIK